MTSRRSPVYEVPMAKAPARIIAEASVRLAVIMTRIGETNNPKEIEQKLGEIAQISRAAQRDLRDLQVAPQE